MKYLKGLTFIWCMTLLFAACNPGKNGTLPNNYLIVAQKATETDADWQQVVEALRAKHNAPVVYFDKSPRECLSDIKQYYPRYVAFVDMPQNIGRDYIMDLNRLSRLVDDDIYADYLWGVITGYDAAGALKMVNNSTEPLVPKNAIATIMELNSGKWFDKFGFIDDHTRGLWGLKTRFEDPVKTDTIQAELYLAKLYDLYKQVDPDLVVTAAHGSEERLEMPFSYASITHNKGQYLYTDFNYQRRGEPVREYTYFDGRRDSLPLPETGKRKVYFPVGNCLIANVNNTNESMAIAWMNGSNATAMVGYVVTTWHGRNGWGALKYWQTTPGRHTLAEAVYLNQQDFLYQQSQWAPGVLDIEYPFDAEREARKQLREKLEALGITDIKIDHLGFIHDRDVLAYYGDPKWDVRLQEVPGETDYTVTSEVKRGKCIITLTTHNDFSLERMMGGKFKMEHVLDIPFCYFFPERLKNPTLAEGQEWDVAVNENCLFLYNPQFEPGQTYQIILDINS